MGKIFKGFIPVLFLVGTVLPAHSQAPDHKPYMWVAMAQGQKQINFFNSTKLPKFDQALGVPQSNRFVLGNFFGMFQYLLDTYGASFEMLCVHIGVGTGAGVPAGYENRLIFIFEPVVTGTDAGYFILHKPFDRSAVNDFKISKEKMDNWTGRYKAKMPLTTIANNSENQYKDPVTNARTKSDTRYITYCVKDLDKLYSFQKHYAGQYNLTTGLVGYLASYLSTGDNHSRFKRRILTEFNLLDSNGQDFYLESIDGFTALPPENSACEYTGTTEKLFKMDNGQLCPTYCPR